MKDTPLKAEFDKISAALREAPEAKRVLMMLDTLQGVVTELQESGMRAGLDVRPASYRKPAGVSGAALVNGTVTIDDLAVDFGIERYPGSGSTGYLQLKLALGETVREPLWFKDAGDAENLRKGILNHLLSAKAEYDLVSAYHVAPNGISRMALDKPAAPKLKQS